MRNHVAYLLDAGLSRTRYFAAASAISVSGAAILSAAALLLFPSEHWEGPFPLETSLTLALVVGVIVGPLIETLVMWPILALLIRIVRSAPLVCCISAFLWALAHAFAHAPRILPSFWSFTVLSASFLRWRRASPWQAVSMTWGVHALQNL